MGQLIIALHSQAVETVSVTGLSIARDRGRMRVMLKSPALTKFCRLKLSGTEEMNRYEWFAFLSSPFPPILLFSGSVLTGSLIWGAPSVQAALAISAWLGAIGLLVAYFLIVVIALPLYLVLRKIHEVTKPMILFVAGSVGAIMGGLVSSLFGVDEANELILGFGVGIAIGFTGGSWFSLVLKRAPNN